MRTKNIPIIVGGGLDTKTNPKLVKPGAALQLDNAFQQRPGEWRVRNGMTTQPATARAIGAGSNLYAGLAGVASVARGLVNITAQNQPVPVRYGLRATGSTGWECANGTNSNQYYPFPAFTCRTESLFGDRSNDLMDGDIGAIGSLQAVTALDSVAGPFYKVIDASTGRPADYSTVGGPVSTRPYTICATPNYLVMAAVQTTGSPYSIEIVVFGANGSITAYTPVVNLVATATPWMDIVADGSGTDTVAIAYKASAGGVSVVVVDASTGTVTVGPTNFAAWDASMCLGFLGNIVPLLGAGHAALATAGSAGGVKYRTINTATLVAGGDVIIDASATANVRQVTGHFDTLSQVTVLWEVSDAGNRIYDLVKRGRFTGSTTVVTLAPSFSLYSRTAKGADGRWYFVGAYDSPVQASYALLSVDDFPGAAGATDNRAALACQVMAGEGGGRRASQSNVANLLASGSTFVTSMPRKKRVTVAGVSASQGRIQQRATFSDVLSTMSRPRELGGVVYLPGGLIYADDGQSCRIAAFPRSPEQCTGVSAAGGSMTSSKSYGYRLVFKRQDNSGRLIRSAGSIPYTITLGAGDTQVTLTIQNPSLPLGDYGMTWVLEVYRNGPIESGASLYNKVGQTGYSTAGTTTITFVDQMSDANAALGEAAYFTGNVEENIAPPSSSLLEVNAGRVWLVNAEDPTELWPSKQSKAGVVPGFTPDWAVRVDGDGRGPITALGSQNSQLVVFKDGAMWAISGNGPDDNGNGTFNPPQIISRETGVPAGLARSVVSTPGGLMFQSSKGIYLFGAGGLEYIGAPVEQYTQAENVVDASTVRGTTQVRFVMASGRCLVWDYQAKTWSTFILSVGGSTIVACVDAASGWYYLTANGVLRKEAPGINNDDNVAIIPTISFPHLNFAGLSGYQRLYSLDILLDVVGNHTISVDGEFNYSGALTGSPKTKALTTATPTVQVQYLPPDGLAKCTAMRPVITVSGSPLNGSFRLTSVTARVGIKSGTNIADGQRLT